MKKLLLSAVMITTLVFFSCENGDRLLDREPQGSVSIDQIEDLIQEFPEKALSVLGGAEAGNVKYMYSFDTNDQGAHDDFGYMSVLTGLDHMTNDLVMVLNHWFASYYTYLARGTSNSRDRMVWNFEYKVIYNMNSILQSMVGEQEDEDANYLKGRALAVRANAYMDLIRTYAIGDMGIPYYADGDNEIYSSARLSTTEVWNHIISDLENAFQILENYNRGGDKEMVDQQVVAGMLARAYMYIENYGKAAEFANIARSGYAPMSEGDLFNGFSNINTTNWMWGNDITGDTSTIFASFFSSMGNYSQGYAGLLGVYRTADKRLYEAIPDSDIRKDWFISPDATDADLPAYAHVKFIDNSFFEGDYIYMRADEFFILEAEALARGGNEEEARVLLNEFVQTRDPNFSASNLSGEALLKEIRLQRRIEMWGEGGEWWEMKRHGEGLERDYEETNHPRFGRFNYSADSKEFYFEIPQDELNANPDVSNP